MAAAVLAPATMEDVLVAGDELTPLTDDEREITELAYQLWSLGCCPQTEADDSEAVTEIACHASCL